jgi:hypothetical protein
MTEDGTKQYFKREWFFNVTFDNLRSEHFKRMQKRLLKDFFLHSCISLVMFAISFGPSENLGYFGIRLMVFVSGLNCAFAFHQICSWKLNRDKEKLENDFNASMKAKERMLADIIKAKCYTDNAPS